MTTQLIVPGLAGFFARMEPIAYTFARSPILSNNKAMRRAQV